MKIDTPLGAYEYRVERARIGRRGLEITGSLGEWETTTVIGPADLAAAARRATPVLVLVALGVAARRVRR